MNSQAYDIQKQILNLISFSLTVARRLWALLPTQHLKKGNILGVEWIPKYSVDYPQTEHLDLFLCIWVLD